ncbi:MAG: hypothetical protein ACYS0G_00730 [Planctomycetota bacterium]
MADRSSQSAAEENRSRAFREHLAGKAASARLRYGLYVDAESIVRMLDDRAVVRYPTSIRFDAAPLQPHEFAHTQPLGFDPSDGYCLFIHPHFERQPENWPLLIAYHIPAINYGDVVEAAHAELFGATLLGLDVETYYRALCELADSIPGDLGDHDADT